MSRAPTDYRNFYTPLQPLQPQASPTDQYSTPAVQRGGGGELLSLANALKTVTPEIQRVIDNRQTAENQNAKLWAQQDYAQKRFGNVQDFRKAVESGQVAETKNPWYGIQLKQLFAQDTMSKAREGAYNEYLQNAQLRDSNNPEEVRNFFAQKMGDAMKGADPWEAEVMAPYAQQSVDSLTMHHVQQRDQTRQMEMEVASKSAIGTILEGVDSSVFAAAQSPDPAVSGPANAKIAQTQAQLQQWMKNQLLTTNKVKVNQWVKDALTDAAMDREDAQVFSKFYTGLVKDDGSPLDNSDASKAHIRDLNRIISERQIQSSRQSLEKLQIQDAKDKREGHIKMAQFITDHQKTDPDWTVNKASDQELLGLLNGMPDAIKNDFLMEFSQLSIAQGNIINVRNEQSAREYVAKNAERLANGGLIRDPNFRVTFFKTMAELGSETKVHTLTTTSMQLAHGWAPQSDPDALSSLFTKRMDGSLEVADVEDAAKRGQLSEQDYRGLWEHVFLKKNETMAKVMPMAQIAEKQLSEQISMKLYDDALAKGLASEYERDGNMSRKDAAWAYAHQGATYHQTNTAAQIDLNRQLNTILRDKDFMALPEAEKQQRLDDMVDQIATKNGGYNQVDYSSAQKKVIDRAEEKKPSAPTLTPPKVEPKPLSPEAAVFDIRSRGGTSEFSPVLAIPTEAVETAHALLHNVPLLATEEAEKLKPPEPPKDRFSWFNSVSTLPPLVKLAAMRNSKTMGFMDPGTPEFKKVRSGFEDKTMIDTLNEKALEDWRGAIHSVRDEAASKEASMLATGFADKYQALVKAGKQRGQLFPAEWVQLRKMENEQSELSYMRQAAGWSPLEVRKMGKDAWRTHAMFTDMLDLKDNGAARMAFIGLKPNDPNDYEEFDRAQAALIYELQHRQ